MTDIQVGYSARPRRFVVAARRIGQGVCALAVSAAVLVIGVGPAHAAAPAQSVRPQSIWQNQDGFESSPSSTWNFDGDGTGNGGFDIGAGTARSGSNDAWMTDQGGWVSVGRPVHLTPAQFHTAQCAAQIYVQPFGNTLVALDVIEPSSWTYIASQQATLNGGSYTAVTVGPWSPGAVDVYIRLVLAGNTGGFAAVRVDDLTVQCTY
jgi:hypothetical protein